MVASSSNHSCFPNGQRRTRLQTQSSFVQSNLTQFVKKKNCGVEGRRRVAVLAFLCLLSGHLHSQIRFPLSCHRVGAGRICTLAHGWMEGVCVWCIFLLNKNFLLQNKCQVDQFLFCITLIGIIYASPCMESDSSSHFGYNSTHLQRLWLWRIFISHVICLYNVGLFLFYYLYLRGRKGKTGRDQRKQTPIYWFASWMLEMARVGLSQETGAGNSIQVFPMVVGAQLVELTPAAAKKESVMTGARVQSLS